MNRIAFLSLFIFVALISIGAQTAGGQVFGARLCGVGSFSFPCPAGYEIKNAIGKDMPYIAVEPKNNITVFAYSPTTDLSESELITEALSKVFTNYLETSLDRLETKESRDFWGDDKWSKFEISKFGRAALDKANDKGFHYQYVHLKINGKQVLAGFIYDPVLRGRLRSETAVTWFNRWRGGGNGDATDALNELITSITKEPKKIAPGGPPPGAAEKV